MVQSTLYYASLLFSDVRAACHSPLPPAMTTMDGACGPFWASSAIIPPSAFYDDDLCADGPCGVSLSPQLSLHPYKKNLAGS